MATLGTSRSAATMRFEGGLRPLVAFFVAATVFTTVVVLLADRLFGDGVLSPWVRIAYFVVGTTPVALLAWLALRVEGLRASDVGLSKRNVLPGLVVVTAIWTVANLLGFVVATLGGDTVSVGLPPGMALVSWLAFAVSQFALLGLVEEFAYRGYVQNKLISLFGGGSNRARKVAGILVATLLFASIHIPQRLVIRGIATSDLLPALVGLFVYALLFAVIYELTRNIVLTGVLHGTFNFQPILVFREGGAAVSEVMLAVLPLIVVAVWAYRRWAKGARRDDFGVQSGPSVVAVDGGS